MQYHTLHCVSNLLLSKQEKQQLVYALEVNLCAPLCMLGY